MQHSSRSFCPLCYSTKPGVVGRESSLHRRSHLHAVSLLVRYCHLSLPGKNRKLIFAFFRRNSNESRQHMNMQKRNKNDRISLPFTAKPLSDAGDILCAEMGWGWWNTTLMLSARIVIAISLNTPSEGQGRSHGPRPRQLHCAVFPPRHRYSWVSLISWGQREGARSDCNYILSLAFSHQPQTLYENQSTNHYRNGRFWLQ